MYPVWLILVAAFFIHMAMYSTRHSFGVFFKSLECEFDLTRTVTSSVFSLHMLLGAAISLLGGWALDKYGARKTVALMGLLIMLGFVLTSQTNQSWQLFITYSLLLALGTSAGHTILMSTVSRAFEHKRGFALGVASAGGGLGTLFISPLSAYLITSFGWRFASIIIGLIAGLVVIILSPLLKHSASTGKMGGGEYAIKPDTDGFHLSVTASEPYLPNYTFSEAIRLASFWFLCIAYLLQSSALYLVNTHVVPHAIDNGIPTIEAAIILSIIGSGNVAGRLLFGFISDTVGATRIAIFASLLGAAALALLLFSVERGVFYVFAALFGLAWGGFGTMGTLLASRLFGVRSIGLTIGSINVGWHIGAAFGPALGGFVFDATASYFMAFIIGIIWLLLASLFLGLIKVSAKCS